MLIKIKNYERSAITDLIEFYPCDAFAQTVAAALAAIL